MPATDVQKPRENKGFATQTNQAIYYRLEPKIRQSTGSFCSFSLGDYAQLENKIYGNRFINNKLSEINDAWEKEFKKYHSYIQLWYLALIQYQNHHTLN